MQSSSFHDERGATEGAGHLAFDDLGYAIVPEVLPSDECDAIAARVGPGHESVGSRSLLAHPWCTDLAARLRHHPALSTLIGAEDVAVQCTYFEKSASRNWLVPIHQDLSVPVAARVPDPHLAGWSLKEGALFVQAPTELLQRMVAVRLHLDACTARDGPLRVVPGSHRQGVIGPEAATRVRRETAEVDCVAPVGAALAMRPLLLHASSKASGDSRRRVLHFLFGPAHPPNGLRWQHAA